MKSLMPICLFVLLCLFACGGQSGEPIAEDSATSEAPNVDCAKLRLVEVRSGTHAMSSVGAFLVADDCEGEPLVGLQADQFRVVEDGQALDHQLQDLKALERSPELFVSLVLERSDETLKPEVASEIIEGAKGLVDELFANSGAKGLRVSVSFVSDHWELAQKFTADRSAIQTALDRFDVVPVTSTAGTKVSLNAHRSFEGLSHALGYSMQTHGPPCGAMKGSVWMLGQTVLVTSGAERRDDISIEKLEMALDKSGEDLVIVQIGSGPWGPEWDSLARNGQMSASGTDRIQPALIEASARLLLLRERAYSLVYCGSNDSGFHEVLFELQDSGDRSNALLFDASLVMIDDLDLQCSTDLFKFQCEDPDCSGLRCDGCAPEGLDYCIATGRCWEVLCTYGAPGVVDIDGTHVYWVDDTRGEVVRIEKATGEYSYEPQALATGLDAPVGIALDDDWVYWTESGSGLVQRVLKSGGESEVLVEGGVGLDQIAVSKDAVFWTSSEGVWMRSKDGGEATRVGDTSERAAGITQWQGEVFWTLPDKGDVLVWSSANPEPKLLAEGLNEVDAIAVDAVNVYVATKNDLLKIPKSGGEPELLAQSPAFPRDIAFDSSHVYWTYDEEIYRVAKSGGAKEEVAREKPMGHGIAVDETHVYWAGLAQILKLVHD